MNIAPFTKENCLELVSNLLTLWSEMKNEDANEHRMNSVKQYAQKFAESPILINMICHLSLDPTFNIETATVLDIYDNICEKLVRRYIKTNGMKDEFNDYHKFYSPDFGISYAPYWIWFL